MGLKNKCKHCEFIEKTFPKASEMTNREYWLFTEVYCYLHDGNDFCNFSKIKEMKKEKADFDNLSYKELQEIYSKLKKDLLEVDKRLKGFDKSIGVYSDGGRGSYNS